MCLKDNLNVLEKTKKSANIDGNESAGTISYKIKFIDSMRFMGTSLSKLFDNLTEGFINLSVKIVAVFLNMRVLRII